MCLASHRQANKFVLGKSHHYWTSHESGQAA